MPRQAPGCYSDALLLVFSLINLAVANKATFPSAELFFNAGNIRFHRSEVLRFVRPLGALVCTILAFFAAQWGAVQWENMLLFTNRVTVGTVDPVIGKDIGFYLFSLPFLQMLKGFASFTLLVTALLSTAVYYVRGGISLSERGVAVDDEWFADILRSWQVFLHV